MRAPVLITRVTPTVRAAETWVRDRSRREQVLIAFFGGFLALTLFWFAIPRPLLEARATALDRIESYEAIMARLKTAGPVTAAVAVLPDGPIEAALPIHAANFGIVPSSVTPDGDAVAVTMNDARYDAVIPWLAALESGGLVELNQVRMQSRPTPGMVGVTLTVRRP